MIKDKISFTYPNMTIPQSTASSRFIYVKQKKTLNNKVLYWITYVFLFVTAFSNVILLFPLLNLPSTETILTPNIIKFVTAYFVTYILAILILNRAIQTRYLLTSFSYIIMYFGYLLLTSLWAISQYTTLSALKYSLINIFSFVLFYLFSLNQENEKIARLFKDLAIPAIVFTIVNYIINPEAARLDFFSTLAISSIFIVYSIIISKQNKVLNYLLIFLSLSSLVLSMNRIWTFSFFVGYIILNNWASRYYKVISKNVILIICGFLFFLLAFFISKDVQELGLKVYSRFTGNDISYGDIYIYGEPKDILRENIFDYANKLIKRNWSFGIGYQNYQLEFAKIYGYYYVTPNGKEMVGATLHNVYQAWLLEGGIPLVMIVFFLLFRYFRILVQQVRFTKTKDEVLFYKLLMAIMIQMLVVGWYHQIHEMQFFWMMFGLVFGLKYRSDDQDTFSEQPRSLLG